MAATKLDGVFWWLLARALCIVSVMISISGSASLSLCSASEILDFRGLEASEVDVGGSPLLNPGTTHELCDPNSACHTSGSS